MIDVIYGPKEWFDDIKNKYPDAIFEDARDEVHEHRFKVSIPSLPEGLSEEWIFTLFDLGLSSYSLIFQMSLRMEENRKIIKDAMDNYEKQRDINRES